MKNLVGKNKKFVSGAIVTNAAEPQTGKWCKQLFSFIPEKFKSCKPVVAVLSMYGAIGKAGSMKSSMSITSSRELIEKAFSLPKVRLVCLNIDSPGGSPVQSELIAKYIISLSKEKKIPVWTFVEDVAASGGYWIACSGEKIYASKSSIIGSIGVISGGFGFHEAIAKLGIERRIYTQGNNKSILDPFQPVKKSDIKIISGLQQKIHNNFIDYVKERRGGKLTQTDEILFNGEFWTGETALDFGLIDGIDDMYSRVREEFSQEVKFEYISPKQSWIKKRLELLAPALSKELVESAIQKIENKIKFRNIDWF